MTLWWTLRSWRLRGQHTVWRGAHLLLLHDGHLVLARHSPIAHIFVVLCRILSDRAVRWRYPAAQHLQCVHHRTGERLRILLTREIEAVNEFGVTPLMKRRCGLIIFETFQYRAIDDDLVILQLAAHHSECVVLLVMIDLDLAEAGRRARRNPLFLVVVVHHHGRPSADNTLFAMEGHQQKKNRNKRLA